MVIGNHQKSAKICGTMREGDSDEKCNSCDVVKYSHLRVSPSAQGEKR